ncbi:hypothetical protein IMZ48_20810 [Candidatus Bathyarchaeota archaeon]|nr:hypothetical protein [Candidatus Bathyarchaeota archaeon]
MPSPLGLDTSAHLKLNCCHPTAPDESGFLRQATSANQSKERRREAPPLPTPNEHYRVLSLLRIPLAASVGPSRLVQFAPPGLLYSAICEPRSLISLNAEHANLCDSKSISNTSERRADSSNHMPQGGRADAFIDRLAELHTRREGCGRPPGLVARQREGKHERL